MLAELFINNLVIIKRDHLFFDSGFNVLSGETGSGKSLILEAINIVLGKRTNKDIIGKFDDKTIIEAVFNLDVDTIKKLEDKEFKISKIWSREAVDIFKKYKNESTKIKKD